MGKIVYNARHGGFGLSEAARARYAEITGEPICDDDDDIPRNDPALVRVVEELGEAANGPFAQLAIRDLPAGTYYRIDEYDGRETVMAIDDYEWSIA